jgi:membrane protease YdiL (CAAX protease family)
MTQTRFPGVSVPVVYLFMLAALLVRAWLQSLLSQRGMDPAIAKEFAYLAVPAILALCLWPALRDRTAQVRELFDRRLLTPRLILYALLLGVLLRIAYWAQLFAGVALGLYSDPRVDGALLPEFGFSCPALPALALGFVVLALITPLVEEFVHRGLIQTALSSRGPVIAIGVSALLFMLVHRLSTWGFALAAGIAFGILFWKTRTLWLPLLAHAIINAMTLLDWRCLRGQWNPPVEHLPILPVAVASLVVLTACVAAVTYILLQKIPGDTRPPGSEQITERLRPVR